MNKIIQYLFRGRIIIHEGENAHLWTPKKLPYMLTDFETVPPTVTGRKAGFVIDAGAVPPARLHVRELKGVNNIRVFKICPEGHKKAGKLRSFNLTAP